MKKLLVFLVLVALALSFKFVSAENHTCPHDKQVICIDEVNKAFSACEKAAREKGKDVPVDLDCMKYFAEMGEDCWECICWVAQVQKINIFGC